MRRLFARTTLLLLLASAFAGACKSEGTAGLKPSDGGPTGGDDSGIGGDTFRITTTALMNGKVGAAYTDKIASANGTEPFAYTLASGSQLPNGLLLAADGTVSGTPSEAGTARFDVTVTDSAMPPHMAAGTITIAIDPAQGGEPLAITTPTLPAGTLGAAYMATIAATGGMAPYVFSVASGSLPSGLALASDGTISGNPSAAGAATFTVGVSDASNPQQAATAIFTITINTTQGGTLSITTTALPDGHTGMAYTATLAASGGTQPYQWTLDPGSSLPPGLTLSASGQITGTPDTPGRYAFTVAVADASNPAETASAALTMIVRAPPGDTLRITTSGLRAAHTGEPYMAQLGAIGGMMPYQWSVVSGALPLGLMLDMQGLISGTASVAGTYTFNVEVTDASTPSLAAQATLTLVVLPPGTQVLTITSMGLPRGVTATAYSVQLGAMGGMMPYTWTVASGTIPPGLTLSAMGAITGMPSMPGAFTFTARVTDSGTVRQTAQRQFSIAVFPNLMNGIAILNNALRNGDIGRGYQQNIFVAGGTPPYGLMVTQGGLPPGLTLDSPMHLIGGTPTMTGTFMFTLTATDSAMPKNMTSRMYSIMIGQGGGGGGVRIITNFLPPATVNQAYTTMLLAFRGTQPYTWSLVQGQGTMPAGLTLSANGTISGTPTQQGMSQFRVQVTDSSMPQTSAARDLQLVVQ